MDSTAGFSSGVRYHLCLVCRFKTLFLKGSTGKDGGGASVLLLKVQTAEAQFRIHMTRL